MIYFEMMVLVIKATRGHQIVGGILSVPIILIIVVLWIAYIARPLDDKNDKDREQK